MTKLIFIISFSALLIGCQTFNRLTLTNQLSSPLVVTFQSYHSNDTTNYLVLPKENRVINNTVVTKSFGYEALELRSITVRVDSTKKHKILRFSNSFLEVNNWTLAIPFPISKSIKYEPWSLSEQVNGLNNHSYYHFVQALYNAGKYADCIKAVDDITPFFTTRGAKVLRNPPKSGLAQQEVDVQEEGILVLAYLSALKIPEPTKAEDYWNALKEIDLGVVTYLQKNDLEIAR